MPEPTIKELTDWLDYVVGETHDSEPYEAAAIRAILEQHRAQHSDDWGPSQLLACSKCGIVPSRQQDGGEIRFYCDKCDSRLEAIRAFVERVDQRWSEKGVAYRACITEELQAMEGQASADNE